MKWPRLALAAVVALPSMGCDRLPFGGSEDEAGPPSGEPAEAVVGDTGTVELPGAAGRPAAAPPESAPPPQTAAAPVRQVAVDEPWEPVHTGTIRPGMARAEVIEVWGEPVTERAADGRAYLYYRNGCEITCGTFDVVFFEGGQVVDAIVRGRGHTYAGTSSSPAGSEAVPTLPDQTRS